MKRELPHTRIENIALNRQYGVQISVCAGPPLCLDETGICEHCYAIQPADDRLAFEIAEEIDKLRRVRRSDLTQNYRPAKNADNVEINKWMETLTAFGWMESETAKGSSRIKSWNVNPQVHEKFLDFGNEERHRRAESRIVVLEKIYRITRS